MSGAMGEDVDTLLSSDDEEEEEEEEEPASTYP